MDREIGTTLEYDEERLKMFIRRAQAGRNLPKEYQLDEAASAHLFADALIGRFSDEAEKEKPYKRETMLAQAALAIDFLTGMEPKQLVEMHKELVMNQKGSTRETALSVAGIAARLYRGDFQPHVDVRTRRPSDDSLPIEEFSQVPEGYGDTGDTVRELYYAGQISSGTAQALLLFLGKANSSVSDDKKRSVVVNTGRNLLMKLSYKTPSLEDADLQRMLEKGRSYLHEIAKQKCNSGFPYGYDTEWLASQLVGRYRLESIETVKRHVESHVAFAIASLFVSHDPSSSTTFIDKSKSQAGGHDD